MDLVVAQSSLEPVGATARTRVVERQVVEHIKSALHPARPEQQIVSIVNATHGTFRLSLRGEVTRPVSYDATADELHLALSELPSSSIIEISNTSSTAVVNQTSGAVGVSTTWTITFTAFEDYPNTTDYYDPALPFSAEGHVPNLKAVGDLPLLQILSNGLVPVGTVQSSVVQSGIVDPEGLSAF